jgi:predicted tellurium resistance membrane protein TerC
MRTLKTYDKDGNLTGYTEEPMSLGAWLFIIFITPAAIQIGIWILIALVFVIMAALQYQPFLFFTAVILLMVIGFFLGLAKRKIRRQKAQQQRSA